MGDIHTQVDYAKQRGRFASTDFEYSVFLLGTRCLNEKNPKKEKIIQEFYACKLNKVQHAVFGRNVGRDEQVVADVAVSAMNQMKVASDLAVLFTEKPMLRDFLIQEYMKHRPEVGLSVAEYIDFTSILFKHCNPVEC
ncbi:hypothetical protein POM88_021111 [Heracleum sosnowskyi]|uniref:Uncharacterized protein n=1 Tax=Heracleum sosnowskyi TaxID=360622 RepID=A0AAD8ID97_9APIA|nr:hypothetical protein POM88_021111 [Heracleum sosnowskyi]